VQIEDVVSTLKFQLVLVVTRKDGVDRLIGLFAVEPEVMGGRDGGEVVKDAKCFVVQGEVELGVLQCWKTVVVIVVS